MIAACLAYIWIIYLGNLSKKEGWDKVIHRTERCDLSLFQLGLRLLDYFLNQEGEPLAGSPWKFLLSLIGLNKRFMIGLCPICAKSLCSIFTSHLHQTDFP